ncbi:MAG: DUF115 domain-containing protein [Treponema sp.]|jgi:hypothetical protein|nr:DUF115 domain-containing protein [Treponema sp.]
MDTSDFSNPLESSNPSEQPAGRGFSVSYRGKTLLSRVDPVAQCERIAAGIPVKDRTLYLCPSPLYGYGLSILLDKLEPNSAVLCVEADEKLFALSETNLPRNSGSSPASPKERKLASLALARAKDPLEICAFSRETWGKRVFRRVEVVRLTGGWQLSRQLYDDIEKALGKEIAIEWGNAMTLIRLGRLYTRNLIRNLALLPGSESLAALDFGSRPVLVLGAGPSLDSLLDEEGVLAGGERRFRIVCVDTCLPALLEREISPDVVVVLESQHWNLADFRGARGRKIDAALDLSALPASTRVLAGKRYFFATPWTELALFARLEAEGLLPKTFAPMGSVGLSAVALALAATRAPVLTAGIDFSYTLDAYHGRSTPGRRNLEARQSRFRTLINAAAALREGTYNALSKTGKRLRSDPAMRNYRDLFEEEFGGNPRLFDIAGPGLPLGIKTVSAAEAFAILNGGDAILNDGDALNGSGAIPGGTHEMAPIREEPVRDFPANLLREKLPVFIRREIGLLSELKETLSGNVSPERLEELLDECDYLWAHFPDCAGAGRRPPSTDLSFLKRVRTEIEPFLRLWEMSLNELEKEEN